MTNQIQIYVADLAAYNSGYLHGKWIDATLDIDDIQAEVNDMLSMSPVADAEEYAIHDYEGFNGYDLGEYEGLETAHEVACFIEEHPEIGGELLNHFSGDIDEAKRAIEESYNGCYPSLEDYAQELTEQTTEVPQNLAFYIDYERMARDLELSGDVFTIQTGFEEVHIFWAH